MNVVLARPDRVGDVVITTTLLPALRRQFPRGRLGFVARETMRDLIAPVVDDFIPVESPDLAVHLRAGGYAASLHLHPHATVAHAAAAAGIPCRVGFTPDRAHLTEALPFTKERGDRHESEHGWDLAARLGVPRPAAAVPCIHVGEPPPDWPVGRGSDWLVLHPGASAGKACLPPALLRAVVGDWLDDPYHRVAVVGTGVERAWAGRLQAEFGAERLRDCCDRLSLPALAGLARRAGVFLGRDSGPAHVAAAAGARVVVVFAPVRRDVSVTRWRPLGPHVEVVALPGRARWWETTARAARRVFAAADPAGLNEAIRRAAAMG
jgi:ADP-heptose:LPS heptosyltransferase